MDPLIVIVVLSFIPGACMILIECVIAMMFEGLK